jgi:hypothetical protein
MGAGGPGDAGHPGGGGRVTHVAIVTAIDDSVETAA